MLTRIEIDGFKSFEDLKLDLQPFTIIAGPNASGKSNFFDALRLLSRLASADVAEALRQVRGDPSELFRHEPSGTNINRIRFAVEALLNCEVEDAFGQTRSLKYTRVRYELEIERRPDELGGPERLYVCREHAAPIKRSDDRWLKTARPSPAFIKDYAKYASGGQRSPFLETLPAKFQVNQDGVQGRPRPFPIARERASATVLSKIVTAIEFPHLFALRQELDGLTFLQLEASAEREPSDALAPDELQASGWNLAKVLARIEAETRQSERPHGALSDIRNSLSSLIPGVSDIRVDRDSVAGRYRLFVAMQDGTEFSSRVLSDGTLRVLSLLTFLHDPRRKSVLLFEEPENGIHEERLVRLVRLLRDATTDVSNPNPSENRLFQVIMNTHSPVVLRETKNSELVAVDVVTRVDPQTRKLRRRTRMRTGISDQEEFQLGMRDTKLSRSEVERILRKGSGLAA